MTDIGKKIALGVIGCGKAGRLHCTALKTLPEFDMVAAADIDKDRLEQTAGKFGIAKQFSDYRKLLDLKEIDAVIVATPTSDHMETGIAVMDAGKHILMEKPLALTLAECDRLIEKARISTGKVMVGFNFRWHRLILEAKKIIQSGKLGALKSIRSVYTHWHPGEMAPDWHKKRKSGGGVLFNDGVHHFDLWRYLTDSEVIKVYSQSISSRHYEDDTATVSASMTNGILASGVFSFETSPSSEIDIYGEKGRLYISCYRFDGLEFYPYWTYPGNFGDRVKKIFTSFRELAKTIPVIRYGGDFDATHRSLLQDFASCIQNGHAPRCGLEDGRKAIETALCALHSLITDRPVEIGTFEVSKTTD